MAAPASQDRLLARLRSAMGGASRIAAVSTYAREAVVRIEATGASGSPSSPARAESGGASTRSLVASLADRLSGGAGRETLVRSAPGRARLELWTRDAAGGESRVLCATAGPGGSRHDHGAENAKMGPSACAACAGEAVLREAALEPRNLLAHAEERGALVREAPDGGLEIVVPDEELLYRFDARTGLCARRTCTADGAMVLYADWRPVDGIATPHLEVEEGDFFGRLERRAIAVAYELPWPASLFRARLL